MPNKNYRKGVKFEYRVRDYFKDMGYEVFRSAGSHSPADLICFPKDKSPKRTLGPLLVQVKTDDSLISKQQRDELVNYAKDIHIQPVLVYREEGTNKIIPLYFKVEIII